MHSLKSRGGKCWGLPEEAVSLLHPAWYYGIVYPVPEMNGTRDSRKNASWTRSLPKNAATPDYGITLQPRPKPKSASLQQHNLWERKPPRAHCLQRQRVRGERGPGIRRQEDIKLVAHPGPDFHPVFSFHHHFSHYLAGKNGVLFSNRSLPRLVIAAGGQGEGAAWYLCNVYFQLSQHFGALHQLQNTVLCPG